MTGSSGAEAQEPVTVLVADDEPRVRDSARRILETVGYRVLVAASGEEALEAARAAPRVHVLLTDMIMPGPAGSALSSQVRDHHPEVAVIYMSGYTEESIGGAGGLGPRERFLAKPFRLRVLLDEIAALLDSR